MSALTPLWLRRLFQRSQPVQKTERRMVRKSLGFDQLERRDNPSGNGMTVVLDPGHGIGNVAGGATGIESRVLERDLTLDMARRVRNDLQGWGFNVTLTRNDDYEVDFYTRTHTAQVVGADFFVSLHFEGLPVPLRGTETFVNKSGNVNLADDVRFADILRAATLRTFSQPHDRGNTVTDTRMGVLDDQAMGNTAQNHPTMSTLLEIESISSNLDVDRFFNNADGATRNANRDRAAYNIALGIAQAKAAFFDNAPVKAPASLLANALSPTQVKLDWTDVDREAGYRIYNQNNVVIATVVANTTSYTVNGLSAGQSYSFRVEAFNATTAATTGWRVIATPAAAPTSPGSFTATAISGSQVRLSWIDSTGETGYHVYQWTNSGWSQIGNAAANATPYTVSALSAGQTYYFYIEAFNNTGSAFASGSATTQAATVVAPAAPSKIVFKATAANAGYLTWSDNSNNESGFRVQYWNGAAWVTFDTLGAGTTASHVYSIQAGATYYFRIASYNSASESPSAYITVRI